MSKDAYLQDLAATVEKMFGDNRTDPSAQEIAIEHFGTDVLGGEIYDGVCKRIKAICKVLGETYGLKVCIVNARYYLKTAKRPNYRDKPPETDAEARSCLPLGHGVKTFGVKLCTGENDRIYQAAIGQGFASGGAKLKLNIDRTIEGYEAGNIPEEKAVPMINDARLKSTPEHLAEMEKIASLLKPPA